MQVSIPCHTVAHSLGIDSKKTSLPPLCLLQTAWLGRKDTCGFQQTEDAPSCTQNEALLQPCHGSTFRRSVSNQITLARNKHWGTSSGVRERVTILFSFHFAYS